MNKSSTWTALRNPAFRKLWIATVISGTCLAAHDSAGTWMVNIATGAFLPSLMSTVCFFKVGLAATAAGLAVLGWLHLLNPYLILVSVFLIGVGFAFDAAASGAGSVVGAVFIIPPLRASLRQLKAAMEYGQVMPNILTWGISVVL